MRSNAPTSEHLIRRYHRWMLLWLRWFAAFLVAAEHFAPLPWQAAEIAHGWLDRVERNFLSCVIGLAARRHPAPRWVRRSGPLPRAGIRRAYLGSALRRAMRARTLYERVAVLLQDMHALAARLRRRLENGLTRIFAKRTRPEAKTLAHAVAEAHALLANDTS